MKRKKGLFITFEGAEGSGKSTQIALLSAHLKEKDKPVLVIREPGGVVISENIRRILLDVKNKEMGRECETLLYMAARAQLVAEKVKPALETGQIVLCDRFLDSTVVYQGYGFGVDLKMIQLIGKFATQSIQPDLTFVFDLPVQKGFSRKTEEKDRIELRSLAYHNRVRQGYLKLARQNPQRVKVIKAESSREEIFEGVRTSVENLISKNEIKRIQIIRCGEKKYREGKSTFSKSLKDL